MAYESLLAVGIAGGVFIGFLSIARTIFAYVTNRKLKRIEETVSRINESVLDFVATQPREQPQVILPAMPEPEPQPERKPIAVRRPGSIIQPAPKQPSFKDVKKQQKIEAEREERRKKLMEELGRLG